MIMNHSNHSSNDDGTRAIYTCPMHPEIQQERPGMCSECGMQLVPVRQKKFAHGIQNDFNKHAGHSTNIFKAKFWVSFILSIPIVAYSDIVQDLVQYRAPTFPGSGYLPFVLASIVFFYGGWIFIASAYRELKARLPGMMTLIALAISVAYFYSISVTLFGVRMPDGRGGETLYWELATLITIMLLGHWIEMRAVSGAQNALKELSKLLPDQAEVIRNGKVEIVPLSELRKDDLVIVKPGGRIPADGVVKDGMSDVNESIATGESKSVPKKEGDAVIAGTTNGDGSLTITVAKIGDETFLAGVMRLVAEAQASKSRLQMLSDRAALYLTGIAVVAGTATFVAWLLAGAGVVFAVERLVAVLVITCPHALGLAIPLVASISTTMAARNGLLIRNRLSLEAARTITTVLFDKTGTLTRGEFGVTDIVPAFSIGEKEVLAMAGSVNLQSEHPLAKAIIKEAEKQRISLHEVKNFERVPGKGARGIVNGEMESVGNIALMEDVGVLIPAQVKARTEALSKEGKTVIFAASGMRLLGAIALADIIREESREAILSLRAAGIHTAMITGDSEDVAEWVAKELGIDEYFAKVLPHEKSEKVKALQKKGYKVAMVGDGVNDAPALTEADLGIAIGAGTNVAIESAGIILVKNDPRDIPKIIKLSTLTYAKMIQNLFWATGYNVIALPLAAGVLASQGIVLQPAVAAVFMSASTVIVAFNAALLRRRKL